MTSREQHLGGASQMAATSKGIAAYQVVRFWSHQPKVTFAIKSPYRILIRKRQVEAQSCYVERQRHLCKARDERRAQKAKLIKDRNATLNGSGER